MTTLINTHTHGDHVSGNVEFPATVDVVDAGEHEGQHGEDGHLQGRTTGEGMPKRTFKDKMTIGSGADQIDLYYFGPGHTNGDAWVVFPAHRIVHAGDIFAGKGMPLIDGNNGGSVLHYSETLMKAHNGIKNVDTIINGHMPAQTTWADLKEFADFNKDFLTWAQARAEGRQDAGAGGRRSGRCPRSTRAIRDRLDDDGRPAGRLQRLAEEMK